MPIPIVSSTNVSFNVYDKLIVVVKPRNSAGSIGGNVDLQSNATLLCCGCPWHSANAFGLSGSDVYCVLMFGCIFLFL